jgi:uncharacterized cupredoxin-like copper-binding protein
MIRHVTHPARFVSAAALTVALTFALAATALAGGKTTAPSNLLVYAQEWSLIPSRGSVPAGEVKVELWNRGQDMHDIKVRRLNKQRKMYGPIVAGVKVTMSGQISHATWHLRAGSYEMYCSMPGHYALGMHTRLRVTKGKR